MQGSFYPWPSYHRSSLSPPPPHPSYIECALKLAPDALITSHFLPEILILIQNVIKYEKMKMDWRSYGIFYFVCETFRYKDMTPQSLRKTHFSQNPQLNTIFTLHFWPKTVI